MCRFKKNEMIQTEKAGKLSVREAINFVREVRNDLIKTLLIGNNLQSSLAVRYNKSIGPIELEFLIGDLHERLIAPVDVNHYNQLIHALMGDTNHFSVDDKELFYKELEPLFKKYVGQGANNLL
jgi:hypothetical protein